MIDTANGQATSWRGGERFALCSTFKLSLAALVLAGARRRLWRAEERMTWSQADLLPHSPVAGAHLAGGLTLAELARAALETSDNAAANLVLRRLGGPAALTAFWRALGDDESRLDRYEPDLNRVPPGSLPDTTTPAAMAQTVALLVTGRGLAAADSATLRGWMAASQTGLKRLRAGLPAGWIAGDKTGTVVGDGRAVYADLAFAAPPGRGGAGRPPLAIAAWLEPVMPAASGNAADLAVMAEAVLAEAGRIAASLITKA